MSIIGTLPNNIQDGQAVDASPVMADFNYIVNQVNANGNPTGTLTAPSGTRIVFHQAAAPTGWAIDSSLNDFTLQLTGGVGAGAAVFTGNAYSGMFNAQWTTDGHALTIAELAVHNHSDAGHTHADAGHAHAGSGGQFLVGATGGLLQSGSGGQPYVGAATTANASANIETGFAAIQNTGSGTAHSHTKTFNVNYATVIVGAKT
jgi:hypothetical protein